MVNEREHRGHGWRQDCFLIQANDKKLAVFQYRSHANRIVNTKLLQQRYLFEQAVHSSEVQATCTIVSVSWL